MASADGLGDGPGRPVKRRKIQLACNACRARKTGCDGKRPCCTSCAVRGWQARCAYQDRSTMSTVSAVLTIADIEKRLQTLEHSGLQTAQGVTPSASRCATTSTPDFASGAASDHPVFGAGSNSAFAQEIVSVASCEHHDVTTVDDTTTTVTDSLAAFSHSVIPPRSAKITAPLGYVATGQPTPVEYAWDDLALPPRSLCDLLLECYWDLFHPLYPVLHRPRFDAQYDRVWCQAVEASASRSKTWHDVVFYATLNMVLAVACQHNEQLDAAETEDLALGLYRRSVRLVSVDVLDTSSLAVVQLLLLRSIYLLYTPFADRCWNTVGVALRAAQAIGLPLSASQQTGDVGNQLTREMRRRVWYNCVILDWTTSIAFGRPTFLSRQASVPLPALIDDEHLSATRDAGKQPDGVPSRLEFFVYALKLLGIREKCQNWEDGRPNTNGPSRDLGGDLGSILDLSAQLDHYLQEIPPHLQPDRPLVLDSVPARSRACFEFQGRALQARVMYTRLRILRPLVMAEAHRCVARATAVKPAAFSTSTSSPPTHAVLLTSELQERLLGDLCRLCLSTVHDVLAELHRHLGHVQRASPWHALYYAFAAASVLLVGTLCPHLNVSLDSDPGKSSWTKAMEVFHFHKAHVSSAAQGIEALALLKKCVEAKARAMTEARSLSRSRSPRRPETPLRNTASIPQPLHGPSFSETVTPLTAHYHLDDADGAFDHVPLDQNWFESQELDLDDWIEHLS